MFDAADLSGLSKADFYAELDSQLRGLIAGERDAVANLANTAALIFNTLPDVNWAGFYLLKDEALVVGPFQGRPACVRIAVGKGVCGTAVAEQRTQLVPDVEAFPGHIPCDSASRSELVVPLIVAGSVVGVLDLDSPSLARFDADDAAGCERLAATLVREVRF